MAEIPILGPKPENPRAAVAAPIALIRKLDESGTYTPKDVIRHPSGQLLAVPHRSDFVTAEELVEMLVAASEKSLKRIINDFIAQINQSKLD